MYRCGLILTCWLASLLCSACQMSGSSGRLDLFQKDGGRPFQVSSHHPTEGDAWALAPGETKVLLDVPGPAIIRNVWFTLGGGPSGDHGVDLLRLLTLRMYWDSEQSPSVEAPFGDFFGCGFGRYTPYILSLIHISEPTRPY